MSDDDRSDRDGRSDRDDSPVEDPFGDALFDDGPSDEVVDPLDETDADETDDPFAALGEGVGDGAEASPHPDPNSGTSGDREPGAPTDDPFAELDADAGGAPTDEDPFESMGSGDVGEEDVWEALDEGTSVGAGATGYADVAEDDAAGDVGASGFGAAGPGRTGDEHVVDKRSYCQRCPHFTAPPEAACSHEGTEIVESVDFSRFRVRNCPMVDTEDPAFDGE